MVSKANRIGIVLVLVGTLTIAVGFVLEFASEYLFLTHLFGSFSSSYEFYAELGGISDFLFGAGAVLAGLGWSLSQLLPRAPAAASLVPHTTKTVVAVSLVLTGASLIAAGTWFAGAIQEYQAAGIVIHLETWMSVIFLLLAGLGIALWGAGWFVQRWPAREAPGV